MEARYSQHYGYKSRWGKVSPKLVNNKQRQQVRILIMSTNGSRIQSHSRVKVTMGRSWSDKTHRWFQNRGMKHKRMQQEEEAKTRQHQAASASKNSHHVNEWKTVTLLESDNGEKLV